MAQFVKVKSLLDEGKQKRYFEKAAIYIGNREKTLFEYFIDADKYTLFDMASLTKIMVTTMITFKFIEEGKLCLFDTLENFFEVPEDKKGITISHLTTHTGGFEPSFNIEEVAKTQDRILEVILERPLYSHVGMEVHYSCIGYIVLGKILEKIGGTSLDKLAKLYVFEPLMLTSSTYNPTGTNIAATEYSIEQGRHLKGIVHDENARFIGASGNAGLFSNIEDVASFGRMLANKGMQEARGLGFSLYNHDFHPAGDLLSLGSFGHTGFTGTSLFVDKESGLYVVLLTNRVFYGREDTGFLRFKKLLHNVIVNEYTEVNDETRN